MCVSVIINGCHFGHRNIQPETERDTYGEDYQLFHNSPLFKFPTVIAVYSL